MHADLCERKLAGELLTCPRGGLRDVIEYCDYCAGHQLSVIEQRRRIIARRMLDAGAVDLGCKTCRLRILNHEDPAHVFYPRHEGSRNCRSGSIASGGDRAHCTCDTCF